ncbi:MAG: LPS-assembly protein LptD [Bacteroidetes bacterium]|nr:LPS-assembly protein LptD [Bacteroidota bacterium]
MLIRTNIFVFFTIGMLIAIWVCEPVFSQDTVSKSAPKDTLQKDFVSESDNSVIKSKIIYSSRDSIRFDLSNQKVFLFGDAKVTYEDMDIKAGYIEFDMEHNIVFARGARDSSGKAIVDSAGMSVGDPVFKQGSQSFDAKQMTYNFQTKKGKIRDIRTEEGEGVIHAKDAKKDTGDVYYVKNAKYSTCDLENPHFYLNATKLKVIPGSKIISGPAYLVVGDVPTPLVLPFGIFPNKNGRKSGILIPFYGQQENFGYFLKDGGYYFGLSDYFDLALRGDIYSQGSFGVKANTNYVKRYKYSGFIELDFSKIKFSEKEFPDYWVSNTFKINWRHAQDVKANPNFRFSANVNAGSATHNKYNSYGQDYLSNTMQSSISMSRSWKSSNLSLSASHSQNTITHALDVTLPEAAFSLNRFYPLKRKNKIGKPNVFDKINTSLTVNARNQVNTIDALLFKPKSLDFQPEAEKLFRNGVKAYVPISTSFNIGPLIITPSASLNSVGYFQTIKKHPDIKDSALVTETVPRFKTAYNYVTALSASTKLYGMFLFKHGRVKAIRHVLTPAVAFSYRPDFSQAHYGFYETIITHPKGIEREHSYSYFQAGIYGPPPAGRSGAINFSIGNNLEMKLRPSKKDTSSQDRKIMLIENFVVSSSYNMAAEHFNWSTINFSGRTQLFKQVNLAMDGVIDPYRINSDSIRIERFVFNDNRNIGRLTAAALSLSTSLRSLTGKEPAKPATSKNPRQVANYDELNYIFLHPDYYVDFNIPWNLTVYYNIVYSKPAFHSTLIQSFTFSGDVNVTKKWKVGFRSGFDFIEKDFTYTSFDIYRDLHCWEMRLNWVPFGPRKSYMVTIAVKASSLQDLKLMKKSPPYGYN